MSLLEMNDCRASDVHSHQLLTGPLVSNRLWV